LLSSDLHYDLPPERIAQTPADRRDESRLLVLDRKTGQRRHERFARLACLLPPRGQLVLNDSGSLAGSTGRCEDGPAARVQALFLRCDPEESGADATGSGRLRPGEDLLNPGFIYRLRCGRDACGRLGGAAGAYG
jgi:S-adenosylmethionine:tRNA ribosyltransferase-isomerase